MGTSRASGSNTEFSLENREFQRCHWEQGNTTTQFLISLARIEVPGRLRRPNSKDFLLFSLEGAPGTMEEGSEGGMG